MAMWLFTEAVLKGEPIRVFNGGEMSRDFTYIDDIVAGVIAAFDHPPPDDGAVKAGGAMTPHRLYNIGNSRPEPLMRLIGLIEQACGAKAALDMQPMQPGDVLATFADISAISADLGFVPATSLENGVPRFVDWYRAYKRL
jgi:UDP-glucuronate 4-epimerase